MASTFFTTAERLALLSLLLSLCSVLGGKYRYHCIKDTGTFSSKCCKPFRLCQFVFNQHCPWKTERNYPPQCSTIQNCLKSWEYDLPTQVWTSCPDDSLFQGCLQQGSLAIALLCLSSSTEICGVSLMIFQ